MDDHECAMYIIKNDMLKKENMLMRKCLKFYADEDNYLFAKKLGTDDGKKAKECLNKIKRR